MNIKRNLDNYGPYNPEDPFVFSRQVFDEFRDKEVPEDADVLNRLQTRYEKIYRENYVPNRGDVSRVQGQTKRSKSKSKAAVPYINEDNLRDSQLISSLISPIKKEEMIPDPTNNIEFREFKSSEFLGSGRKLEMADTEEGKKQLTPKKSPKKPAQEKVIHPMFKEFEKELNIKKIIQMDTPQSLSKQLENFSTPRANPKKNVDAS